MQKLKTPPPPPEGFVLDAPEQTNNTAVNIPAPPEGFTIDNPKSIKNDKVAGIYEKRDLARKMIPQFTKGLSESDLPFAKEISQRNPLLNPQQQKIAAEVNANTPRPEGLLPWIARETGNLAPTVAMAAPFEGAAGLIPGVSRLGKAALGFGAYEGTKDILQGQADKAPLDSLKTAAAVWAGGKAIGYAMKGAGKGAEVAGKGLSKANMALKTMTGKLNESELGQFIQHSINKAVRPSVVGKTASANQLKGYYKKAQFAVEDIIKNKMGLQIKDENGQVVNKLPENLDEFVQAIDQRMGEIFKQYNGMAEKAGEAGIKIDLGKIADDIENQMEDKAVRIFYPELRGYAMQMVDRIRAEGPLDPDTIQKAIAMLNSTLKAYYRNPNPNMASKVVVDLSIITKLRKALDEAVSGLTGESYKALKQQYGAYREVLTDVLKRSVVDARKNTKGFFDLTDVLSTGDIVKGLATMNPADVTKGFAMRAAKDFIKKLNDPNEIIKNMFRAVEKNRSKLGYPSAPETVMDAEFSVIPKMLEGPQATKMLEGPKPSKILGVTDKAGPTKRVFLAGEKGVEASFPGFERGLSEQEAMKRLREYAMTKYNPDLYKIEFPEGVVKNPKNRTMLKKMGIDPFTGKFKFKPLQTAFQKAWEKTKKGLRDERGFVRIGKGAEEVSKPFIDKARKAGLETFTPRENFKGACWVLPDGTKIKAEKLFNDEEMPIDHDTILEMLGLDYKQAYKNGFIRQARSGMYSYGEANKRIAEKYIQEDIINNKITSDIVIDIDDALGNTRSFEIPNEVVKEANYNISKLLNKTYEV